VGLVRLAVGQYEPPGHETCNAGVAQNEPAAQGIGAVDEAGQKLPELHVTCDAGVVQ